MTKSTGASGRILGNGHSLGSARLTGADMFTWISEFEFAKQAGELERLFRRQHDLQQQQLEASPDDDPLLSAELEEVTAQIEAVAFAFVPDDGSPMAIECVTWSPGRLEFRVTENGDG